ncbi:MAG: hypothetical protein H7263_06565 [Candidatus Sericytochromatia bacterium]|nr:hypothetical protein [Candidatus Sericytochromatia bacterium]
MIREIKYVCTASVDYFTCHALFSKISDGALSKLSLNSHSKQPEYRVFFQDRVITIIVNDEDINIVNDLPKSIEFNHQGKKLITILASDTPYEIKSSFNEGQFVTAKGVISYAKNLSNPETVHNQKGVLIRKHKSPIMPNGEILKGEKQATLDYLEKKLGIDLRTQTGDRSFRFEMLSYKNFESKHSVYSKSNQKKLSLHNVFSFEIQGFIKNANTVNSLEFTSIGKKRSYGFGNIYIKHE